MENTFITLASLARDLDLPEKKVRRQLKRLINTGKFQRDVHYDLADYQDEYHFTYLVDPQSFIREARLEDQAKSALADRTRQQPATQTATRLGSSGEQNGSPIGTPRQPSGSPSGTHVGTTPRPNDQKSKEQHLIDFLMGELKEKNQELKEWRGLLPDYQEKVTELISADI